MWREFMEGMSDRFTFSTPAQQSQIDVVEEQLEVELPDELVTLWLETNGVRTFPKQNLVWSTEDFLWHNQEAFRDFPEYEQHFMPFDNLLFFSADAQGRIAYGYGIARSGDINYNRIYRWDRNTDSRVWVAMNLKNYIELDAHDILNWDYRV